jgi:hypothetical protein
MGGAPNKIVNIGKKEVVGGKKKSGARSVKTGRKRMHDWTYIPWTTKWSK